MSTNLALKLILQENKNEIIESKAFFGFRYVSLILNKCALTLLIRNMVYALEELQISFLSLRKKYC